jgi:hypothetical protein
VTDDYPRDSREAEASDAARAQCIDIVAQALGGGRVDRWGTAAAVVDEVEEILRADEREKKMAAADIAFLDAVSAREELATLRAQVEVLHDNRHAFGFRPRHDNKDCCDLARVLALFPKEGT